jgi:hypothetical protein
MRGDIESRGRRAQIGGKTVDYVTMIEKIRELVSE